MPGNASRSAEDDAAEIYRQAEAAAIARRDAERGTVAPADVGPPPAPPPTVGPYQPNPGRPGYQPNPGMAGKPIPQPKAPEAPEFGPPPPPARPGRMVERGGVPTDPSWRPPPGSGGPTAQPVNENEEGSGERVPSSAQRPAGAASGASAPSGGTVIPGGMYPHTMTTSVKEGKAVPEESKEAARVGTALRLQGISEEEKAAQALYAKLRPLREAEMHAASDASVAHADVQARRDAEVRARLEEIETTNRELANEQIDPNKFWHDRGALAKVIGAFASALGGAASAITGGPNEAANAINSAINRDIEAQMTNRSGKHKALEGQIGLLKLHQERLGDEAKAIDATKLAYYENILQQMNMYRDEFGVSKDDAGYKALTADILERYGELRNKIGVQEQAEKTHEFTQQYHMPQVVGGAVGAKKGDTEWLAKEYQEAKIPETLSSLQAADQAIDTLGTGDIPGTGKLAGAVFGASPWLGKQAYGEEAATNYQIISGIKNNIRHSLTGSALSDTEKAYASAQLDGAGDANALRIVVQGLRRDIVNKAANIRAGKPPEAQAQYEQQGGSVTRKATQLNRPSTTHLRSSEE